MNEMMESFKPIFRMLGFASGLVIAFRDISAVVEQPEAEGQARGEAGGGDIAVTFRFKSGPECGIILPYGNP